MRVLLDECLPWRLKGHLHGHEVMTVDSNLAYQQHLVGLPFAVVVVTARSNRLPDLMPIVPQILEHLETAGPGQVIRVAG
jgi:hypothetical protein